MHSDIQGLQQWQPTRDLGTKSEKKRGWHKAALSHHKEFGKATTQNRMFQAKPRLEPAWQHFRQHQELGAIQQTTSMQNLQEAITKEKKLLLPVQFKVTTTREHTASNTLAFCGPLHNLFTCSFFPLGILSQAGYQVTVFSTRGEMHTQVPLYECSVYENLAVHTENSDI